MGWKDALRVRYSRPVTVTVAVVVVGFLLQTSQSIHNREIPLEV